MQMRKEMAMGVDETHILVFPSPGQGHMSPMIQFSKRLASKGVRVTLVTTISASNSMHIIQPQLPTPFNIQLISDGSEHLQNSETIDESLERFRRVTTQTLADLIISINKKNTTSNCASHDHHLPVALVRLKCLVYDSSMPWILDIARQQGIDGAPFFTQSCAVTAIYHHFYTGLLKIPISLEDGSTTISLPSMPLPLGFNDLPSFLRDLHSYPVIRKLAMDQFLNFGQVKCLLCNTFDKLEHEAVKWMTSQSWPIKTVGPTIPSVYSDNKLEDDKDYNVSLFNPNVETCMKWLDSKEIDSVVYAAFGSVANLGKEQMEELAWGLKNTNYYFLWVVRDSEKEKLPNNFLEEISEKGLVVSWCPQLQVLSHKAVGCFVTHCGWNSTLESLSLGVPMVAMPQWSDQATNAKFVADVWKVGVRVKVDENGFATKEEISICIRQIMEKEKGMEIREALLRWKELVKEAVDEGGSSEKNIDEFVAQLLPS